MTLCVAAVVLKHPCLAPVKSHAAMGWNAWPCFSLSLLLVASLLVVSMSRNPGSHRVGSRVVGLQCSLIVWPNEVVC